MKAKKAPLSERDLVERLRAKYPAPAWVVLTGVRTAPGIRATFGYMDALAMSVWPSRGLELYGFELKSSRSDWLRELKKPQKGENFFKYLDHWYVVAGSDQVVKVEELPPGWGLLVPYGRGLKIAKDPGLGGLPAEPGRLFLASVLRRFSEMYISREDIQPEIAAARKHGRETSDLDVKFAKEETERYRLAIAEFEKRSGVRISEWDGKELGETFRLAETFLSNGAGVLMSRLERETAKINRGLIRAMKELGLDPPAPLDPHGGEDA